VTKKPRLEEELDGFIRQFKWSVVGIAVLFVALLVFSGLYLDTRFTSIQESMRYRPPAESTDYIDGDGVEFSSTHAVQGQIVYVPAYSHIYHDDGAPYLLTITLSVRNTSIKHEIIVKSVRYFDTKGKDVKSYLAKPLRLAPLATTEFLVERNDVSGGSGANFLVEWVANEVVSEPIIEAVMVDTKGQQGISFARSGKTIQEVVPPADASGKSGDESPRSKASESK